MSDVAGELMAESDGGITHQDGCASWMEVTSLYNCRIPLIHQFRNLGLTCKGVPNLHKSSMPIMCNIRTNY
eukprot:492137-Pelagomonas_calceolata.AAC.1